MGILVPTFKRTPGSEICRRVTQIHNSAHTPQTPIQKKSKTTFAQLLRESKSFSPQNHLPMNNQQKESLIPELFQNIMGISQKSPRGKETSPKHSAHSEGKNHFLFWKWFPLVI